MSSLPARPSTLAAFPPGAVAVELRVLETTAELRSCVALQREIWGATYDEIVPSSLLRAALRVGALVVGAWDRAGELVGFVFGLTGVKDGEVVHWSHMLGVLPAVRDQGIGSRLKERQRVELARRGVARMYWTFDPLQARNAHLNINKLGARVVEYVENMYGPSRSPLHPAGTDRVVVECATSPREDVARSVDGDVAIPILTVFPQPGDARLASEYPAAALIEIPWDLHSVVAESAARGAEWRAATRRYFGWALEHGYTVTRVIRDGEARRAGYVIERAP